MEMSKIIEMLAEIKADQGRMEAKMDANHKKMMALLDAHHERTMASLGKTEATNFKANPEEMESVMEHREVPNEEVAVKSSATIKRRHRGWKPAAGRRGKPKKMTRGDGGSGRKSAASCRRKSHRAKIAWRESSLFRKILVQASRESRKEFAVAHREMTHHAKVTWSRGYNPKR
jgi:hypothetical protein